MAALEGTSSFASLLLTQTVNSLLLLYTRAGEYDVIYAHGGRFNAHHPHLPLILPPFPAQERLLTEPAATKKMGLEVLRSLFRFTKATEPKGLHTPLSELVVREHEEEEVSRTMDEKISCE